jgi:hypothetical protein
MKERRSDLWEYRREWMYRTDMYTGLKKMNEDENGTLGEEPRTMKKKKGTSEWEEGKNKGKMRSFVETKRATRGRRARIQEHMQRPSWLGGWIRGKHAAGHAEPSLAGGTTNANRLDRN